MSSDVPDPRYARADDGAYIAYQVAGDGPVDIAWQFDFIGNIDVTWENPLEGALYAELASFARLILHDRRAFGLSSRNVAPPNLETRASDLRTVLDAAGSESTVLGGWGEGMAPCVLLAAHDPARVRALIWQAPRPRTVWAPDYPWGWGPDEVADELDAFTHWGTIEYGRRWAEQVVAVHGVRPPEEEVRAMAKESRQTCTPDVILEMTRIWWETDVRAVLPSVHTPTLLLVDGGAGRTHEVAELVASLMPQATLEVLPQTGWPSGSREVREYLQPRLDAIRRFIGVHRVRAIETILSTVLFTDIVRSTEHQARLGDRGWKELVERHHAIVREALEAWQGFENDTAGDGFYATFQGPARAIRCALEICRRVRDWESRSAPGCTPASASSSTASAPASPSPPGPASPRSPTRRRCSCRRPSRTSSQAAASRSPLRAGTS